MLDRLAERREDGLLGGDECVIVAMHDSDNSVADDETLCAGLLDAVRQSLDLDRGKTQEKCVIAISLGYAHTAISDPDLGRLEANSDITHYEAKPVRKSRMTRFKTRMRDAAERRLRLENDPRHAGPKWRVPAAI